MGNCQAVDAAALVIQHPSGKIERYYWPVSASEVMKMNPGHYVSLIIPLPVSSSSSSQQQEERENLQDQKIVRFTRVKLLRPTETLVLGHAYKLITSQEVMKVLRAKKCAKMKMQQDELTEKAQEKKQSSAETGHKQEMDKNQQETKQERHRQKPAVTNSASMRSKTWRPSLQSISEAAS